MEVIQQKLRELEIAAHTANMQMDDVINLVERQFFYAAVQRNRGNAQRVAADIGRNINTVYKMLRNRRQP